MRRYAMFSEDMQEEELCKFGGSDSVVRDVPLSSQGVGLSTKLTRSETDNQVELAEVL